MALGPAKDWTMPINPSPAVRRAGQLLWIMAKRPSASYSVSELARQADIPRATCDSVLQALVEHGLVVRREPELRYGLGAFGIALGDAAREANPILSAASREAEDLARRQSACVAVSAKVGGETRVMAVSDWGPPLALRPRPGHSMPIVPPLGSVFVAWNDAEQAAWLARVDDDGAGRPNDRWRAALAAIRQRGYSISLPDDRVSPVDPNYLGTLTTAAAENDRQPGDELVRMMQHSEYLATEIAEDVSVRVTQISAPIFDSAGDVTTCLMLMGPQRPLTGRELHALGEQVAEAALRAGRSARGQSGD